MAFIDSLKKIASVGLTIVAGATKNLPFVGNIVSGAASAAAASIAAKSPSASAQVSAAQPKPVAVPAAVKQAVITSTAVAKAQIPSVQKPTASAIAASMTQGLIPVNQMNASPSDMMGAAASVMSSQQKALISSGGQAADKTINILTQKSDTAKLIAWIVGGVLVFLGILYTIVQLSKSKKSRK